MYRPQVNPPTGSTAGADTFLGYNHNLRIGIGEFYDMKNLTGDHYPVLTPRKARGEYHVPGREEPVCNVTGAISHSGRIYYTSIGGYGTGFLLHDASKDGEGLYFESTVPTGDPRTLIAMGAHLLIFPDKKYYNTVTEEYGDMEASFEYEEEGIYSVLNMEVLDDRGKLCSDVSVSLDPTDPADGCIAFDSTGADKSIKRYNAKTEKWVEVSKLYVRLTFEEQQDQETILGTFWEQFESGDSLIVTEAKHYSAGVVDEVFGSRTSVLVEWLQKGIGEEEPVLCVVDTEAMHRLIHAWAYYYDGAGHGDVTKWTMERGIPDMDFVFECNNRLWGCRCGEDRYGEYVNEIYASQQGSFKSWHAFAGISTDSYVASCGPSGAFTGAVNFNGYPLFFKQDHYWLVSGDYPAQYGYRDGPIIGVMDGSGGSLTVMNRLAYYHAADGIRVFDGYDSTNISAAFGDVRYENATAGTDGDKLYVSMQRCDPEDTEDEWSTFVYDAAKGLWHKEDALQAKGFFAHKNRTFIVTSDGYILGSDATLMTAEELRTTEGTEEDVEWMAETGNLLSELNFKYLKRLTVRMTVHEGAEVRFLLQYDDNGKWQEVGRQTATNHRFVTVPIAPRRCDHLRLRIEGKGKAEVYAITKTYEKGSDVG